MEKLSKISKLFNKIYYNIFVENFKGKLEYNFPLDYYRWDLIKYLINKYNYIDYLEIGCDQDQLFSKIDMSEIQNLNLSGNQIADEAAEFLFKANL